LTHRLSQVCFRWTVLAAKWVRNRMAPPVAAKLRMLRSCAIQPKSEQAHNRLLEPVGLGLVRINSLAFADGFRCLPFPSYCGLHLSSLCRHLTRTTTSKKLEQSKSILLRVRLLGLRAGLVPIYKLETGWPFTMSRLDAYRDSFPNARLTRSESGVLEVALHTDGGTLVFDVYTHEQFVDLFHSIGSDPYNRVVVLTGTGQAFMESIRPEGFDFFSPQGYDKIYREGKKLLMNILDTEGTMVVEPRMTLLDALREELALTATKKGCDRGECGACTVHVEGCRVLSCMTLALMQEGKRITTIKDWSGTASSARFRRRSSSTTVSNAGSVRPARSCRASR
jgi:hypothetical protein